MTVCLWSFFVHNRLLANENGLYKLANTFCHVGPILPGNRIKLYLDNLCEQVFFEANGQFAEWGWSELVRMVPWMDSWLLGWTLMAMMQLFKSVRRQKYLRERLLSVSVMVVPDFLVQNAKFSMWLPIWPLAKLVGKLTYTAPDFCASQILFISYAAPMNVDWARRFAAKIFKNMIALRLVL